QMRMRRCARPIACAIRCERSGPCAGVNQTRTSPCQTGSTAPLPATSSAATSCAKSRAYAAATSGDETIATTFSWRDHASSDQLSEPVQTVSPSRTTYLWCIRSGTPGTAVASTGSDAISVSSGDGGGGTGIGFAWSTLYASRMRTPRAAARRSASPTMRAVSAPRSKSYCARSSVRRAPSRKSATATATSSAVWPPSVRVRSSMSGFIDRLAAATIGATHNFYRLGERAPLLRERLERYLDERAHAPFLVVGEAPGFRGTRVSGIPLTSERQLTGVGPAEATATIVHRVLAEHGAEEEVLLWNVVPTHPGDERSNRPPTRAEAEAGV